jgi:hypothetical protein
VLFTWDHANDVSAGEDGIDFLSRIVLASVMAPSCKKRADVEIISLHIEFFFHA